MFPAKALTLAVILLLTIGSVTSVFGATYYTRATGNWNANATWSTAACGGAAAAAFPVAGDIVNICNGNIVTVNVNSACASITINGPNVAAANNGITINGSNILTVSGSITMFIPTANATSTIAVGTGTLNAGSISIPGSSFGGRNCIVSVSTGTINVSGNITFSGTPAQARLTFTGSGILNIAGDLGAGGTFTASTGMVNCNGTNAATIAGYTYYNLVVNKSATATTVTSASAAFTTNNNLNVTQGSLVLQATNANYTVSNNLVVSVNGILIHSVNWDLYGRLLQVSDSIIIDGIFNYTERSHVQMNSTTTVGKTVRTGSNPASAFCILTLVNVLNGNFYASGTLTINDNFWAMYGTNGTFHTNGQAVTANSSVLIWGGAVNVDGGTLNVTGGLQVGTVAFAGTANISAGTLNTDFINVGNGTVTGVVNHSGGTANITGNLLIYPSCSYTCSTSPSINISGNWTNNGTFTAASSTVTFNAGNAQNLAGTSATTFNNLVINKSANDVTLSGSTNTTVGGAGTGTLTLTSGDIITNANYLIVSNTATTAIIGGSSSSYIIGNLRRGILAGANTYFYPIGTSIAYAPASIAFTAGTATGNLSAYTSEGDHAMIGSSTFNASKTVNRTWTFTIASGLSPVFYGATFNWVTADQDLAFNYETAYAGRCIYNPPPPPPPAWSYPTVGTQTPTSLQVTGLSTAFGDFQVGNNCVFPTTPILDASPDGICSGQSTTLSITSGILNDGTDWYWYSGSCGGTPVGTGTSITVSPAVTTTYYCRGEGGCSGSCGSITVTVNAVTPGNVVADQTICSGGDPAAFTQTVAATGTGVLTYQWQSSTTGCSGPFTNIPGATATTYNPPAGLLVTTYYRRVVTSTLSSIICTANSNCLTVSVNNVTSGTIAADQTICSGGDPLAFTESVTATGLGVLTYQWQSNTTSCAGAFINIAGATAATYDPPAGLLLTTYYRRIVTSTLNGVACTAITNCLTVTINNITSGTVAANQTICSGGDPASFTQTVAATGTGTLTYQWQSNTTGCAGAFTNIPGATGVTYDPPAGLLVTTYYHRIVTSTLNGVGCSAVSNCITVTINNVNAGTVASDQTICSGGDPAAFTESVPASGTALTYQWQSSTTDCSSGFTNIAGATGVTYNVPAGLVVTTYYRRVVTSTLNGVVCTANSNCLTVYVNNVASGTIATNQTICSGGDPLAFTESVAATGTGVLTYQWQSNTTGCAGAFSNIAGATSVTYDPPAGLVVTTYYRRVVTSTLNGIACSANSNCLTVTVNNVTAGTVAANQTICAGGDPAAFTQTAAATGSGVLTYQWQSSTAGCGGPFTDIAGATGVTYDVPAGLGMTTYYRRVVTSTLNGVGCSVNSNCLTVTVNPLPVVSITADYCQTDSLGHIKLTAHPDPPGYNYLWSTGQTAQIIYVDIAAVYSVTVTNTTTLCSATAFLNVATELVPDGNFTTFNPSSPTFVTGYTQVQSLFRAMPPYPCSNGLWPEGTYGVDISAWSNVPSPYTNCSVTPNGHHPLFHGRDHTNNTVGPRNFMMVNGSVPSDLTIWQKTVTVLPNTNYYFSAWGMNLNPASPARLRFEVNGVQVGSIADLNLAPKPTSEAEVNLLNWIRFYSTPTWNSGATTTAVIRIVNLNTVAGGNDFGLDDISFGTLDPPPYTPSTPQANGGGPVCLGGTLTLSASVTGGIGPFSYYWTGPDGWHSNLQNPTRSPVTLPMQGTYSVVISDLGTSCPGITLYVDVTVLTPPTCSITGTDGPVCPNSSNTFTAPADMSSYAWTISGNGSISGAADLQTVTVIAGSGCNATFTLSLNILAANGCNSLCQKAVNVNDVIAPVIIAMGNPPNGILGCNPTAAQIEAALGTATATDNCGSVTPTFVTGVVVVSGCNYSQTRTWNVSDACGNAATPVSRTATWSVDGVAPIITATGTPPNGILGCNPTAAQIEAALGTAIATDNCGSVTPTFVTGAVVVSGCNYSQTRTWNVSDACGNAATPVSRTATWSVDGVAPIITATGTPPNGILGCNPTAAQIEAALGTATAIDNCGAVTPTFVTGAVVVSGCNRSQTRTWNVSDACGNNAVPVSRTATWILDGAAPVISTTAVSGDLGCNPAVIVPVFTGLDNCDGVFTPVVTTVGPTISGCSYSQTWTANYTDACGNPAIPVSITRTWTVDLVAPAITCPMSVSVMADPGQTYATVSLPAPTYSDNCTAVASIAISWVMTGATVGSNFGIIPVPFLFNVGTTTVTYTATDLCGNAGTCVFTVTVAPNDPPDITCPANISQPADPGLCSAAINPGFPTLVSGTPPIVYTWVMAGATAGSGTGPIVPNPYTFNVGITTITWTATNIAGSDVCTQTITVIDNQPPTFTTPGPFIFCVINIDTAYWNLLPEPLADIDPPRPEYYLFETGNTTLDLNPATFADNCPLTCVPPPEIRWRISFDDGSFLPPLPALYNTGQPSVYPGDIQFPGSVTSDVVHTITYQIVDCHGNVSLPVTINITIKPRPNVIKMP